MILWERTQKKDENSRKKKKCHKKTLFLLRVVGSSARGSSAKAGGHRKGQALNYGRISLFSTFFCVLSQRIILMHV